MLCGKDHFDALFQMGNDGTTDTVTVHVCSDANEVCCETKLKATMTNVRRRSNHTTGRSPQKAFLFFKDWSPNQIETWKTSMFGDCAEILFKVLTHLVHGTGLG